jgi:hypothetical protein
MAIEIQPLDTKTFHGVPSPEGKGTAAHHAVTTHMPGWDLMLEFTKKNPEFFAKFVDMYPRFIIHRDIKAVSLIFFLFICSTRKEACLSGSISCKRALKCMGE